MERQGGTSLGSLESARRLSDRALVERVNRMSRAHRALTAELVAHLAEMDARRLYRSEATPSMFAYCVRRLGFSDDEACRRIDAARIARKWPMIFEKIVTGELSLSVVGKLKPFLTDENVLELGEAVSGKSVREAERILAARFPKPDVPASVRKLPDAKRAVRANHSMVTDASAVPPNHSAVPPAITQVGIAIAETATSVSPASSQATTATAGDLVKSSVTPLDASDRSTMSASALQLDVVDGRRAKPPVDRGRMQPLSEDRIQVKFTASRSLEEKIELARDLMSHRNSRGDLATIIEAGMDLLIADLLKKKLGQTKRGQKKKRPAKRTHVSNQTRREVAERDGLECTFVSASGEHCGERAFLELDHRKAKGEGGGSEPDNVRLLCHAHNQLEAERVYGKAFMERKRKRNPNLLVRDGAVSASVTRGAAGSPSRPVGRVRATTILPPQWTTRT